LNSKTKTENSLYLVHFGKVLKTSKLYKAILKVGSIKEIAQPKPEETISVIKKSINITDDAAKLLLVFSGGNLFQIRNEVKKLQNYLTASSKTKIESTDIEDLCVKNLAQNDVWGIGSKFLNYKLDTTNLTQKKNLLKAVDQLMDNNVPSMQILYSFHQYTLNAIKMKRMIASGKGFKECMAFGYFFAKEFFEKREKMKLNDLFEVNSKLLDYEFKLKSGEVDEVIGLRGLILSM
jgi:DNA polymerase III delta subunit